MKPISIRPIFTLAFFTSSNKNIIRNSQFVAFSTHSHQSSYPRRHEEESRAVRVSVWWDFENCSIPVNTNAFRVAQCITNAVRANGIKGPIQITAFGDVMQISRTNQEALSSTGINLTHVPSGGKNSADRSLLVDLMYWVSQNPPPAHVFLISGDRDFAGILHRLRMNNYNILLSSPDSAPNVLCSAATVMWQWSALLKGENLNGKFFNQPPDGPFYSWYGHLKAPLEDPFAVTGQSSSPVSNKPCDVASDSKLKPITKAVVTDKSSSLGSDESFSVAPNPRARPIPKAVLKYVSHFLQAHPEGIAISRLREALNNSNLAIEKDLYGYKKFSRFLSAMTHILDLQYGNDGVLLVRSVNTKSLDESVSNGEPEVHEVCSITKPHDKKSSSEDVAEKSTVHPAPDPHVKAVSTNLQEAEKEEKHNESSVSMKMQGKEVQEHAANLQNLKKEENRKGSPPKKTTQDICKPEKVELDSPVVEMEDSSEKNENHVVLLDDNTSASVGFFRRIWMILFGSRDTKRNVASSFPALFSPSSHEAMLDREIAGGEKADQFEVNSKQLDLFSKESFWKEMESFINSSQISDSISKSRTRENLAHILQKQGPPVLKSLSESYLLHLVDLLICDKRWVAECSGQIFPFILTRPLSSNGLAHIFSAKQANQESRGGKHQNRPHAEVPHPILHRGSLSKARKVVLADCKRLVDHIVKEHPEGFNIGGFRKLFLEKHGYALDQQKLGYEKLVNLLQIIPGVRVESNLILPAGPLKKLDEQNFHLSTQENKVDTVADSQSDESDAWNELGPIENVREEMDTRFSGKSQKGRTEPDYEPLKEDDLSDSEEETYSTMSDNKNKPKKEQEEGSLLDILDSWYVDKGGNIKKNESTGTANPTDSEEVGSPPSTQASHGTKNGSAAVKPHRRPKTGKTYSFVSEEPVDTKDKLVEGILGSLKKSGEKSADSQVLS